MNPYFQMGRCRVCGSDKVMPVVIDSNLRCKEFRCAREVKKHTI